MSACFQFVLVFVLISSAAWAEEPATKGSGNMKAALRKLKLPGIELNLEEQSVDVEATVCLHEGSLELIACAEGTKEHESILALSARPMHIHTAMLLMGAKPGNPAMKKVSDGEGVRWVPVDPSGDQVWVSLVFTDPEGKQVEQPISQFVSPVGSSVKGEGIPGKEMEKFPNHFLFAGSHLVQGGPGPKKYVCEQSGNVISISTFGDEFLCLPGIHGHNNKGLVWQVNPEGLPGIGEKVTLRLRRKPKFSKS
jgi:hypothetical protein